MNGITRRGAIGRLFASMIALAGCNSQTSSDDEPPIETTRQQNPSRSRSSRPEQEAVLEDGEPLSETAIGVNSALSNGYAATDGTWDYFSSGGGLYRMRPDGSRLNASGRVTTSTWRIISAPLTACSISLDTRATSRSGGRSTA